MSTITPQILTEPEKTVFTTLRRAKNCYVRMSYGQPPKRAWKLMDARHNPIEYIDGVILQALITKKYIGLKQRGQDGPDREVEILFSPGKYW